MAAPKRLQQIVMAREAQPGDGVAAASLFAEANADFVVKNPSLSFTPELFTRDDLNKADLESLQPLAGVITGEGSFEMELTGRSGTTAPTWGLAMEACGFAQVATLSADPQAITGGPLYHGEVITQATSGASGYVIHETYNGASKVYIEDLGTGTGWAGQECTGEDSGATFTPMATPAADGFAWYPTSYNTVNVNGTTDPVSTIIPAGEVLVGQTSGAVVAVHADTISSASAQNVVVRVLSGIMQASETLAGTTADLDVSASPNFAQLRLPTVSLGFVEGATAKALNGARGSVAWRAQRGQAMGMTFSNWSGIPAVPIDLAQIPVSAYSQSVPAPFLGVDFLIGQDAAGDEAAMTVPFGLRSFSLDHNSTTTIQEDATSATGLRGAALHVARSSTAELEVEVGPEAVFPYLTAMRAGTPFRGQLSYGSGTNLFKMSFPGAIIERERAGDQGGLATRGLQLRLGSRRHGGTDAPSATVVLTYTNQ